MRILVISDSHGRTSKIEEAIESQREAKHIFFLGDCVRDIEDYPFIYPDRTFHIVSGNCDYSSTYKSEDTVILEGKKILFTHGHHLYVKGGIGGLKQTALREGADIVLFGHTHIPYYEKENGVIYANPGSISRPRLKDRCYGVIEIDDDYIGYSNIFI